MIRGFFLLLAMWLGFWALDLSRNPRSGGFQAFREQAAQASDSPLLALVERIQAAPAASTCEQTARVQQIEIASALDARRGLIESTRPPPSRTIAGYQSTNAGSVRMLVRSHEKAPTADHWNQPHYSWRRIHADFVKIRRSNDPHAWAQLRARVQHILMDDEDRLLHDVNYQLDHAASRNVLEMERITLACMEKSECAELAVPATLQEWLHGISFYRAALLKIRGAPSAERKRAEILDFYRNRLKPDADRYRFNVQPFVKRTSPTEWRLTLDGTGLDLLAQRFLEQRMSEAWSTPEKRVSIQWRDMPSPLSLGLFRFILEPALDGRAYVNHLKRTVHLFPMNTSDAFQHEMGHVLGFKDTYYTVWQPEACAYREENNSADIMSNHNRGSVLARHWEELERQYPL